MKYQNKLSIQNILGIIALYISIVSGYLVYDKHSNDPCFFNKPSFIIFGILSIGAMISSIGMFLKNRWSRIAFSILLNLFIISFIVIYLVACVSGNDFSGIVSELSYMTMFVFIPLVILIMVLHNKRIVDEFNNSHVIRVPSKIKYSVLAFLIILLTCFCWHVAIKYFITGDIYCSLATDAAENNDKVGYAKARKYFEMAASRGNIEAMYLLGKMYLDGKGIDKDVAKADKLFLESADKGYHKSQYSLGLLYLEGKGVEEDYVKAKYWFEMASSQNNANAQYKLGTMYLEGKGVDEDMEKAKELFKKAKARCHDAKIDLLILEKQEKLSSLDRDKDKAEIEINLLYQKVFSGLKSEDYKSALDAYLCILPLLKEDDPRYQQATKLIVQLEDMIRHRHGKKQTP